MGCGDRCEVLCRQVSVSLDTCMSDSMTWSDVGARGPVDFAEQCRRSWERRSNQLTPSDLSEAIQVCGSGSETLESLSCDEIRALYR